MHVCSFSCTCLVPSVRQATVASMVILPCRSLVQCHLYAAQSTVEDQCGSVSALPRSTINVLHQWSVAKRDAAKLTLRIFLRITHGVTELHDYVNVPLWESVDALFLYEVNAFIINLHGITWWWIVLPLVAAIANRSPAKEDELKFECLLMNVRAKRRDWLLVGTVLIQKFVCLNKRRCKTKQNRVTELKSH